MISSLKKSSLLALWLGASLGVTAFAQQQQVDAVEIIPLKPQQKNNIEVSTASELTIQEKTEGWDRHAGFQTWYWDADQARVWLEIEAWDQDFLFSYGLATGLGSNPVGLDRGQLGKQLVCQFRRVGNKVFLVARNLDYRALSENSVERRAVQESFAESIIWGGVVEAQTETSCLVDFTDLLTSDLHEVATKIQKADQGKFDLDQTRSGIYLPRCRAFPENTELESTLTFVGSEPGRLVQQVTPSPNQVTLRQHVSFVKLPDDNYRPRWHHPRCASMHITFADYATPLDEPLEKRWILRHRLEKQDPQAERSTVKEPIVYYVDPGAPELIRDALIEGASWWNAAFEAAGFLEAFRVEVLPDDADPMDVRYNVIQWVHRSTRGWSYGGAVVDPRTGEIIKGHVSLGSLRVRQDRLLFDALGLHGLAQSGTPVPAGRCGASGVSEEATLAALGTQLNPVDIALARIRQLSAHEVGHTLGFVHNFAGSTYDDRASVMDYPAPRVLIDSDGNLDLSDAYAVGMGSWDIWSVQYAYQQFEPGKDEAKELSRLVENAVQRDMAFVSDADSRPAGAAHPSGNLWDNGTDSVEELKHVMQVRKIALSALQPKMLRDNDPLSDFEQLFVPLYLHHRFQVEATVKMIGGVYYDSDVAQRAQPMKPVASDAQRKAFEALLETISIESLSVDDSLWKFLVPKSFAGYRNVERFQGLTDPIFDRMNSARIAADMTLGGLLNPARVSRLAMEPLTPEGLTADGMIIDLVNHIWQQSGTTQQTRNLSRVLRQSLTDHLLKLVVDPAASVSAQAAARSGIEQVKRWATAPATGAGQDASFKMNLLDQIRRFELRPYPDVPLPQARPVPPGSPIGQR